MRYIVSASLVLVGLIHLLPVSGMLGAQRLAALYGVELQGPDLLILLRQRAVLFGLLGSFMLCAAFKPWLQTAALVMGLVSVASFLALAWLEGRYNHRVHAVVMADVVAVVVLLVGLGLHLGMIWKH